MVKSVAWHFTFPQYTAIMKVLALLPGLLSLQVATTKDSSYGHTVCNVTSGVQVYPHYYLSVENLSHFPVSGLQPVADQVQCSRLHHPSLPLQPVPQSGTGARTRDAQYSSGNNYIPHPKLHFSSKILVNQKFSSFGPYAMEHPMYTFLKGVCPAPVRTFRPRAWYLQDNWGSEDIFWNFEKFLIDHKGSPRFRIAPATWGAHGEVIEPFLEQLFAEQAKEQAAAPSGN